MPTRSILSVPKPCHENWQTMTPAAQGRHCAACDKVVVDFTRMTDAEVLAYLGQSAGKSCGRFRAEQLDRPLVVPAADVTWRKRWVALAALLGLGATAASTKSQAQQPPRPVRVPQTITLGMVAAQPPAVPLPTLMPPLVVRGVVVDSTTYEPLPGATIMLVNSTVGVSTNAQGEFELYLPETYHQIDSIKLNISTIGYENRQVQISPLFTNKQIIMLAPSTQLSGELVVAGGIQVTTWYTPRGLWHRLTQPFRKF